MNPIIWVEKLNCLIINKHVLGVCSDASQIWNPPGSTRVLCLQWALQENVFAQGNHPCYIHNYATCQAHPWSLQSFMYDHPLLKALGALHQRQTEKVVKWNLDIFETIVNGKWFTYKSFMVFNWNAVTITWAFKLRNMECLNIPSISLTKVLIFILMIGCYEICI